MALNQPFLVPYHLPVELVRQHVYSGVEVLGHRVRKELGAADVGRGLGPLIDLIDTQHHMDVW